MDNLIDLFKGLNINKREIPAYLKIFLKNNTNITLITSKYSKSTTTNCSPPNNNTFIDESNLNEENLDLTGNPLEVHLGGDDTLLNVTCILQNPYSWSNNELNDFPVPLNVARKAINANLRTKISPIYALCDASDPQKTVILGTEVTRNKFLRVVIHILGYYPVQCELTELENMKLDHLKHLQVSSADIQYLITKYYNMVGYHIKNNCKLENIEYGCSARLEIISKGINQNKLNMKLLLQVIAGHRNSPLIRFWDDLRLIQSFIKIALDSNLKHDFNTIISNENKDIQLINDEIVNILKTVNYMKKEKQRLFDLNNLRQENISDSLWTIMKKSSNLSDLRDAFQMLFEELLEGGSNLHTVEDDTFIFANIINKIVNGKLIIPNLSMCQSLEILIELGLEKLHNDYMAIINNFYVVLKTKLKDSWSELNEKVLIPMKSRTSINPKVSIININLVNNKLLHLYKLNIIAEFMLLRKEYLVLTEECLDRFHEDLMNMFLKEIDLSDVENLKLHEFNFSLHSDELYDIPSSQPEYWSVEMKSVLKNSLVTTIFNHSHYPIFPNVNYNEETTIIGDDTIEKSYYVTKCVKYSDNI